jgi:hypothetical protein
MGNIADDIPRLRDAGKSDEEIISGVKSFSPEYAGDIDKALKAGKSAKDVVDGLQSYDAKQNPHDTSYLSALQKGAADLAGGVSKTMDMEGVKGGVSGSIKDALGTAGNLGPQDYQPAAPKLMHPSTWGQIPRALVESAPSLATDVGAGGIGAGIGGAIGGALGSVIPVAGTAAGAAVGSTLGGAGGMALSHWLHSGGNDAQEHADARAGAPNAAITDADKNAALINAGVQGTLGRVGLKGLGDVIPGAVGSAIKAEGGSFAGQLATQMVKGSATDAATAAAGDAAKQLIVNDRNLASLNPESLGNSALMGAAQGAAVRGVSAGSDLSAARKYKNLDPETVKPVADMLLQAGGEKGIGKSGAGDFEAISKVDRDLNAKINNKEATANVNAHIKAMDDTDPGNNVHETLLRVKQDIKAGQQVNPEDMALLKDKLGGNTDAPHSQELVDTLGHQNTLNAIKAAGNWDKGSGTFMGGLSGSPIAQKYLHPLSVGGIKADVYANIAGTVAHSALPASLHALSNATASPWLMAAEPILRSSVYGAMKGADALTGNRSPLRQFTDRFSSDGGGATSAPPTEPPRGLSFLQNQRMQDLAAKAVQKSAGQAVGEANSEPSGVDSSGMTKSLKASLAQAKRTLELMQNSEAASSSPVGDALRVARLNKGLEDAHLSNAKKTLGLMQNSEAASSSPVGDALRVARLNKGLEDAHLSNAKKTLGLMQNSEAASSSDAAIPIRVAKLKADFATKAEKDAAAADRSQAKADAAAERAQKAADKAAASKAKEDAKALAKAQKAMQTPKVTKAVPETPQKPVNGNAAPQATPVAKQAPKASKDSPDEPYPEDKYHKITVGSQTVYRSKEGIKDPERYIAATKTNMRNRADAVAEAKSSLPPKELPKLHGILTWLNQQPTSWSEAYSHIEDVVNRLPEAHQAKAMDALSKVKGTFKEQ